MLGFEEIYEVSDFGRVRTVSSLPHYHTGRVLAAYNSGGYFIVPLSKEGKRYTASVHRLVAGAFLGAPPEGSVVNHKDGNSGNNHPLNLEYITQAGNMRHAKEHGLMASGERRPNAKLTWCAVAAIRAEYRPRVFGYRTLGKKYGVDQKTIQRVVKGERWLPAL